MKRLQVMDRNAASDEPERHIAAVDGVGSATQGFSTTAEPVAAKTAEAVRRMPTSDAAPAGRDSELRKRLHRIRCELLTAKDLIGVQAAAASVLKLTCAPLLLAWHTPPGARTGESAVLHGLLSPIDGIQPAVENRLRTAAEECLVRDDLCTFELSPSLQLTAIPLPPLAGHCLLMIAESVAGTISPLPSGELPKESTAWLLMLSAWITEWGMKRQGLEVAENAQAVAAMIELVAHVQSAPDAAAACQRLADALQKYLLAAKVIVGICRAGVSDVRVAAISGGEHIDRLSEETWLVESVLQESLVRSTSAVWPVRDPGNRHALLAHQQFAEVEADRNLVSMPVRTELGEPVGSILVLFSGADEAASTSIAEAERFLRACAGAIAGCLSIVQKLADSRWLHGVSRLRAIISTSRLQMLSWICGAVALVMLVPITYRVRCGLELQPVERHYVAAPFAGPLEKCLVEPGDVVTKNQLLAQMDGREVRWEVAEAQASLNKATKERNTQLSEKEFGSAAIAGHEMERLEQRLALLAHRNGSLEIRSPLDGVVVSGDHREAEGVPLEMGKTLFEIAPLNSMVVEICIPEADVRHIHDGMTVDIQLEAVPEKSIRTVIRRIHPRAELRDSENVFVAEADLLNDSQLLRPGMRGTAKVNTMKHSLGWVLFHKPVAWLLGWLGW